MTVVNGFGNRKSFLASPSWTSIKMLAVIMNFKIDQFSVVKWEKVCLMKVYLVIRTVEAHLNKELSELLFRDFQVVFLKKSIVVVKHQNLPEMHWVYLALTVLF
jgi:hypothetical protein